MSEIKPKNFAYIRFFRLGYVLKYDINDVLVIGGVLIGSVFSLLLIMLMQWVLLLGLYAVGFIVGEFFAEMHRKNWSLTKLWFNLMSFLWGMHLVPFVWLFIWLVFFVVAPLLQLVWN